MPLSLDKADLREAGRGLAEQKATIVGPALVGALLGALTADPLGAVMVGMAQGLAERLCKHVADSATRRFAQAGIEVDDDRARAALLKEAIQEALEQPMGLLNDLVEQQKDLFLLLFACLQQELRQFAGQTVSSRLDHRTTSADAGLDSLVCRWKVVAHEEHEQRARDLITEGRWQDLTAHYDELNTEPRCRGLAIEYLYRRALVERHKLNQPDKAANSLWNALCWEPSRDDICLELGEVARQAGSLDSEIAKVVSRLKEEAEPARAAQFRLSLARWYNLTGESRRATDEVLEASRMAPRHSRTLRLRGEVFLLEGHLRKAQECFSQALTDPLSSSASNHKASDYESLVAHDHIREQMALHYGLARICESYLQRSREAMTHYRAALGMYALGQSVGLGVPSKLVWG